MRQVLCVVVLLLYCRSAAAADPDPPPASAFESPVLKRIFANWKARRQRFTSLRFVWDVSLTVPKGHPDFIDPEKKVVAKDRDHNQRGNQLWILGDDHFCAEFHEWPSNQPTKAAGKEGIVGRQTFNGELDSRFWVSITYKFVLPPQGSIHRAKEQGDFGSRQLTPILFTYRSLHPWMPWRSQDCRLITENAIIDGARYTKIEQTVSDHGIPTVDACWVDPRRDDVVVAWERRPKAGPSHPTRRGLCDYQKDRLFGWVPRHWRVEFGDDVYLISESTITAYEFNKPIPAQKFDPHFPPETYVADSAHRQWYLTKTDGSKRLLSYDEFRRLTAPVPIAGQCTKKGKN
jgi:hypothetical protein